MYICIYCTWFYHMSYVHDSMSDSSDSWCQLIIYIYIYYILKIDNLDTCRSSKCRFFRFSEQQDYHATSLWNELGAWRPPIAVVVPWEGLVVPPGPVLFPVALQHTLPLEGIFAVHLLLHQTLGQAQLNAESSTPRGEITTASNRAQLLWFKGPWTSEKDSRASQDSSWLKRLTKINITQTDCWKWEPIHPRINQQLTSTAPHEPPIRAPHVLARLGCGHPG